MPTAGRILRATAHLAEAPGAKAGYSGTPLPRKLGIRPGHRVGLEHPPSGFEATLGRLPEDVRLMPAGRGRDFDVVLLFARNLATLDAKLAAAIARMAPATALWICWPKKTSPLASDVDENEVRKRGLAAGIVDIKVCAVDADWSGLKFVFRLKDRPALEKKKASKKK